MIVIFEKSENKSYRKTVIVELLQKYVIMGILGKEVLLFSIFCSPLIFLPTSRIILIV